MLESILNYLDHFTREILVIQIGVLFVISSFLIWIWFYNKKKYNNLKHQIPATVVKSYLDSIITNSDSIKSGLFRGGGLDVDPSKIPAVMPVGNLPAGGDGGASSAEVASLRAQLAEKTAAVGELESKLSGVNGDLGAAKTRIEELEKLLEEAKANGGGDIPADMQDIAKERDELKQRIQEYAIIEDDLANLKRLQQENEQLRKALEAGGGTPPPAAEPTAAAAAAPEPAAAAPAEEPAAAPEPAAVAPVEDSAPQVEEASNPDAKSPDDLLSEFEKMLG